MWKLLIVDNDSVTRTFLARVLKPYAVEFEIIAVEDGNVAIETIKNTKINLVLTDLEMPVLDGYKLLTIINENRPEIPVFTMTASGSQEIKSKCIKLGAAQHFEKPLNLDILTNAIFEEFESLIHGEIAGVSLNSFLQLIEMESKTCALNIQSNGKSGNINFLKGKLISADAEGFTNDEAVFELVSWNNTTIKINSYLKNKAIGIKQPLMSLLMQGLQLKDEKSEQKRKKRPLSHFKKIKSNPK